jgi:uncharacterized membrane protein
MPFCPSCGASATGGYCQSCGAALGSAAGAGRSSRASGNELADNVASALCYLLGFVTGVIFLALAPYNRKKNIRFHAFQSVFLSIAVIALNVLLSVVFSILPFRVSLFVGPSISLAYIGIWLFMMWKAYQNETVKLPIIGDLAAKQA